MVKTLSLLLLVLSLSAFASTPKECLDGNFRACQNIIEDYGRTSNKMGATSFLKRVCSSEKLKVICKTTITEKSDTISKALELANPHVALLIINGKNKDKIYQISQGE